ncbi:glycosyltransferase [Streptacidiphilus monticola]
MVRGAGRPRVRYFRNPQNLGVTGNFNRCVELAEYERMVMMGCDDLMHPNYLAVVRAALARHPEAWLVQPGVEVIGSDGQPYDTLADRTKRMIYAPKQPPPDCSAARSWRRACCAATGCTSRRSAGAPRTSAGTASARTSASSRTSPSSSTSCWTGRPWPSARSCASATAGTRPASRRPRPSAANASTRPGGSSPRPGTGWRPTAGTGPPRCPGCTCPRGCTRSPCCPGR